MEVPLIRYPKDHKVITKTLETDLHVEICTVRQI